MRTRILAAIAMLFALAAVAVRVAPAASVTVSAAVSLKEALSQAADAYAAQSGDKVELNFGATGRLLAQIREGAPVDVFVAASDDQMNQAETHDLVDRATRTAVAGNRLVLIVPRDAKGRIDSFEGLSDPAIKRLAVGEPRVVPAGQYAQQVLRSLKLESALDGRIVHGASVRQVLDYVERGEVDAGIVYATDAKQSGDKVRVVATAKPDWHDPIRYAAATVARSKRAADARRFIDFLAGEAGQKILASHGFTPPPPPPATGHASTTTTASSTRPTGDR
jgi:molybdate transport system substrate-binding protein